MHPLISSFFAPTALCAEISHAALQLSAPPPGTVLWFHGRPTASGEVCLCVQMPCAQQHGQEEYVRAGTGACFPPAEQNRTNVAAEAAFPTAPGPPMSPPCPHPLLSGQVCPPRAQFLCSAPTAQTSCQCWRVLCADPVLHPRSPPLLCEACHGNLGTG